MLSLIVTAPNEDHAFLHAKTLCEEQHIAPIDITEFKQEGSIGVEDIRVMQKSLFLTPLKSAQKAIIIRNADSATLEAQNALLKVLEEPPQHAQIILTGKNTTTFVPTILSRCKIIELEQTDIVPKEELKNAQEIVKEILTSNIPSRLAIAQELAADKEKARLFLKHAIFALHETFMTHPEMKEGETIQQLQQAYTKLMTTNVNPRMLLEYTFLSL